MISHYYVHFKKNNFRKDQAMSWSSIPRSRETDSSSDPSSGSLTRTYSSELLSPCSQLPSCRQWVPEEFPDLDFHQSFGLFLTRKNPISRAVDEDIARYWHILTTTPALLQYHIPDIGEGYRNAFRQFFGTEPISLHGHVSDAANPFVLTSLLMHLTAHATNPDVFFLSEEDRVNPRVATTHGSYGAGYGPLAYNSVVPEIRTLANGTKPFGINTHNPAKIGSQVKSAKAQGCVALIAEIVRAADGTAISPLSWRRLLEACKRYTLVLIVDEALTAIRCGAPFAHQLPEYCKFGYPDLILFGKAVRTNGIAVEWNGSNIRKLGITNAEQRDFLTVHWQERLTEMAHSSDLLTSWGTLVLAKTENWPQRAQIIGRILRNVIKGEGIKTSSIGGLHSLIYLRQKDNARISWPVMGANAGNYVRWLPTMDEVMTSKDELFTKVFGPDSVPHRKQVSAYLRSQRLEPRWCSGCGVAVETGVKIACERCVANQCEICEPGEHVCLLEDFDVDVDS